MLASSATESAVTSTPASITRARIRGCTRWTPVGVARHELSLNASDASCSNGVAFAGSAPHGFAVRVPATLLPPLPSFAKFRQFFCDPHRSAPGLLLAGNERRRRRASPVRSPRRPSPGGRSNVSIGTRRREPLSTSRGSRTSRCDLTVTAAVRTRSEGCPEARRSSRPSRGLTGPETTTKRGPPWVVPEWSVVTASIKCQWCKGRRRLGASTPIGRTTWFPMHAPH